MSKVAIITRTKDRPLFLKRAIYSVYDQTAKDYVHVIVNDGGDVREIESVIDSVPEDAQKQIKLFHRTKPSGAPDTIFNESVDRVDSKYVVIHDDDDSWHHEFLDRTLSLLQAGSKGVVVRTDRVYEELLDGDIKPQKKKKYMPHVSSISLYRQCAENQLTPIAFIYERDAYEKVGKYDSQLPVAGDWEFGIRFLLQYDVDFLDPGFALANYHQRTNIKDHSFTNYNHDEIVNRISNKYLRQEISQNKLGVGYIMSALAYERQTRSAKLRRLIPSSILKQVRKHTS